MEQLYLEQLVVKPMPKKQENIRVKVKIVDKTKEMHINREMILNRLHNKNLLQVRKQVPMRDNQIITIKKPKKINETIKIEQEEEEEKGKKVEEEEEKDEEEEEVEEEEEEKGKKGEEEEEKGKKWKKKKKAKKWKRKRKM